MFSAENFGNLRKKGNLIFLEKNLKEIKILYMVFYLFYF